MGDWGFLLYAVILMIIVYTSVINILTIIIILCFARKIRKYINRHFIFFCLGSLLGSLLGGILGFVLVWNMDDRAIWILLLLYYAPSLALLFTSPTFIILSLVIFLKNSYSITNPSSKRKSFTFGFFFFSIVCFIMVLIIAIRGNLF